jgi:hypothetical protein
MPLPDGGSVFGRKRPVRYGVVDREKQTLTLPQSGRDRLSDAISAQWGCCRPFTVKLENGGRTLHTLSMTVDWLGAADAERA